MLRHEDDPTGVNRVVIPFLACGDLSGYDADQSYPLPTDGSYVRLEPVQPPIAPAYKSAIERDREEREQQQGQHAGAPAGGRG